MNLETLRPRRAPSALAGVHWRSRENIRSRMKVAVKRILKKHGWPLDLEAEAVQTVIRQAEAIARNLR